MCFLFKSWKGLDYLLPPTLPHPSTEPLHAIYTAAWVNEKEVPGKLAFIFFVDEQMSY